MAGKNKKNRFLQLLESMSLVQQMFVVMMMALAVTGFFFIFYLRENAREVVVNQNYSLLTRLQNMVIREYREDPDLLYNNSYDDDDVAHMIIEDGVPTAYFGGYEPSPNYADIYRMVTENTTQDHFGTVAINGSWCYYKLTTISARVSVLSLISAGATAELRESIVNNITNATGIYATVVLILLFMWMSTIIHPLNQIRSYAEKIRKGEKAELKIDRSDEIGDVARALTDMHAELQHQDEVKEEMIHNISHDLKTPIATIKSYAESLKDGIYPFGTLDASVDVIIENADRLDAKVHSLLFLNRLDYLLSSSERQMNSIDMNRIVETVVRSMSAIRDQVEIVVNAEPTVFRGEEESWRICVENLLDNGLRYANSTVRIELHPGYLSVGNDGPGIPEDQIRRLFRPFEKGTDGKFGLGLSICSKVAEAYGYTIEAQNTTDGVKFVVQDKMPVRPPHGKKSRGEQGSWLNKKGKQERK